MKALILTSIVTLTATILLANYNLKSFGDTYAESICFNESLDNKVCADYLENDYLVMALFK